MLDGLEILARDASTKIIVLIAKHPARKIADAVIDAARKSRTFGPGVLGPCGSVIGALVPKRRLRPRGVSSCPRDACARAASHLESVLAVEPSQLLGLEWLFRLNLADRFTEVSD